MTRYTTKEMLNRKIVGLENYKPGNDSVKDLALKITSGTTAGEPTVLVIKRPRSKEKYKYYLKSLSAYMAIKTRHSSYSIVYFFLRIIPIKRVLCVDKKDINNPHFFGLIHEFNPTDLDTIPSFFNSIFDIFKQALSKDAVFESIKRIFLTGEAMSSFYENRIKEIMPHALINFEYGLAESDTFTRSCKYLAEKYKNLRYQSFHPLTTFHRVTICNPDDDGTGEIVLTSPELSNYRTGDMGQLMNESCPCGSMQTLLVYGRFNYDVVHCAGATILLSVLEKVFEKVAHSIKDYYIEVREINDGNTMVGSVSFTLVPVKKLTDEETNNILRTILCSLYVTPNRTLGRLIEEGLFLPPRVRLVDAIPVGNKKIKLRKVD